MPKSLKLTSSLSNTPFNNPSCECLYLIDYHYFLKNYLLQEGNPKYIDDIQKDLHRQFPFHEMFQARGGSGQEDLFRVLKAYSIHNPRDGYCQAQAPIAAVLLMHMPAEQAFWCLVAICEKYLQGYYSVGLVSQCLHSICNKMSFYHVRISTLSSLICT